MPEKLLVKGWGKQSLPVNLVAELEFGNETEAQRSARSARLLAIVRHRTLNRSSAVIVAGICLVLLPLCGATGLVFVPLLTLWLLYCGVLQWHAVKVNGGQRWISSFLIGTAVITLCIMGLYFVGYKRPTWNPPNPRIGATLKTTAKFLALGFGPVAAESWTLSVMVAFGFLLPSAAVAVLAVLRHQGLEKHRALGILLFFGNLALFALAIGWGRAGYISKVGLPMRYVLLAVPTLCTAYFVWELYGSPKLRTVAQRGLLLGMCLLLPFNTVTGLLKWGNWYRRGMEAVEQDLLAGNPPSILAGEHRDFLIHWWDENQLAEGMQMLQDAGIGPFAQMQEEPVNSESSILK